VPQVKAGKVRALGTMGNRRLPELPDVPTFTELGIDLMGARGETWFGMFGPKGTPAEIVARLAGELGKIASVPELAQRLALVGQFVDYADAASFRAQTLSESRFYAQLIKDLDLKLE
jgi:tripartite-type tricarboxylate transporter receptor subunit TctC